METIATTVKNLQNPQFEGLFINRFNKETALADRDKRFENLKFVAEHNLPLAQKIVAACFLEQVKEKKLLAAVKEVRKHTDKPISWATERFPSNHLYCVRGTYCEFAEFQNMVIVFLY